VDVVGRNRELALADRFLAGARERFGVRTACSPRWNKPALDAAASLRRALRR
jgi:hypothetical protein